jgi:hypothetical protein
MRKKFIVYSFIGAALLLLVLFTFQCSQSDQGGKASQTSAMDKVARGKYLVSVGGCNDCHTPKMMTEQGQVLDSTRFLSGHPADEKLPSTPFDLVGPGKWGAVGSQSFTAWVGPWGVSFAANLTPDMVTGSGAWTEESFISAMRTGKHLGAGRDILPPMPWFNVATATDEDLSSIFAYLKSIKPVENMVPAPIPPPDSPSSLSNKAAGATGQ